MFMVMSSRLVTYFFFLNHDLSIYTYLRDIFILRKAVQWGTEFLVPTENNILLALQLFNLCSGLYFTLDKASSPNYAALLDRKNLAQISGIILWMIASFFSF